MTILSSWPTLVQDEHGREWVVKAGDPAAKLVSTLKAYGFDKKVLPGYTVRTGWLTCPLVLPADTFRRARLLDCLEVLCD